jgi:hypothetical protein
VGKKKTLKFNFASSLIALIIGSKYEEL